MTQNTSRLPKLAGWFDPRGRKTGTFAFILNRITGLGLTLYLFLHLLMLGNLARGPEAYDSFIKLVKNPIFLTGEFLVVAAGLIHGLNGVRIILTSFGVSVPRHQRLFYVLFGLAVLGSAFFAWRMFGGEA
jgi:succinate dehydrogenase / fumarate reductase cytochrome b subunit